jgi:hypothetical protein
MALVLHLGGVGEYVSQIWGQSVRSRESGDLHRDSITQAPRRFALGITLGIRTGCGSLTLCLEPLILLLNHDLLDSH